MTGSRVRFAFAVLLVAALHFAVSFITAFIGGISGGFSRVLANILVFPLSVLEGPDNALLGWLLWAALSLLWGIGSCLLLRRLLPKA